MLKGTYTALVTPFNSNHEVDFDRLEALFDEQCRHKVDGVVVLGTTGETPTLFEEEQQEIVKRALKALKGKMKVIVGTGTYATHKTIKLTQAAEEAGADAALIVTPYYNKPTQEGIYKHFEAISQNSLLPIIVYNIQGRTGRNIDTDTLKKIADLPTVIGVKEASGNIEQMMEVLSLQRPDFSVLCGDDALTLPLIALGGHGVISVVSNLVPALVKKMVDAALAGDFSSAQKLHYQLLPLFKGAFLESNPAPIKEALNIAGFQVGGVRLPLCGVKAETRDKLKAILAGLL